MFKPQIKGYKSTIGNNFKNVVIDLDNKNNIEKSINDFIKSIDDLYKNNQTEGHLTIPITRFLETFFTKNYINSNSYKGQIESDLVIKENEKTDSNTNVIIELKKSKNEKELITKDDLNKKSFHEIVLYYLYERIVKKNSFVTKGIITDGYEWYLFDSSELLNKICNKREVVNFFNNWYFKKTDSSKTQLFYDFIETYLNENEGVIKCEYFDLRTIKGEEIVSFIKYFSPFNILKEDYSNDSNSLNKNFYFELLHILGLEEQKKNGKLVIDRCINKESGSLMENTLRKIEQEGLISNITLSELYRFGENTEERIFNLSLELVVTWVNRILFLKLLESQLINFNHLKNKKFLTPEIIHDYDVLNNLFFEVLSEKPNSRRPIFKHFEYIPYLNSSLFETTDIERMLLRISNLDNSVLVSVFNKTVLKDKTTGKRLKDIKLKPLEYLLTFLDSYNFGSNNTEDLQKKDLINSSVLGLIFEKINGYKDGSVYTPSFITMYLSNETVIRRVLDVFNEKFKVNCKNVTELHNILYKLTTIEESNKIIDNLKICDPSVGSGHFLVSVLNSIIKLKSDLGILIDDKGKRLLDVQINTLNDELIVLDENGDELKYSINENGKPNSRVQNIQKTLFNEKKKIIENCLFGVDINSNSVKICRLRLWIELLKNSYYTESSDFIDLETLPNIDINIKVGNSLLSRYRLEDDLKEVFGKDKSTIQKYKELVFNYKNTNDKSIKKNLIEPQILEIRNNIKDSINGKTQKDYHSIKGQISTIKIGFKNLESFGEKIGPKDLEKLNTKEKELRRIEKIIKDVEENIKYKNSFEWRYEFSEVLDENGDFNGFDIIIGNPPYIKENDDKKVFDGLRDLPCYQGKMDIWYLFGCLGMDLLKSDGYMSFISTNNWTTNQGGKSFRNRISNNSKIIKLIDFGGVMIFDDVSIQTMIMIFQKNSIDDNYIFDFRRISKQNKEQNQIYDIMNGISHDGIESFNPKFIREKYFDKTFTFNNDEDDELLTKIINKSNFKLNKSEIVQGIVPNPDYVNTRNIEKFSENIINERNIKLRDGVFVVSKNFFPNLMDTEHKYLKPVIEPTDIDRFYIGESKLDIIYINKSNYKSDCPTLLTHLEKYREIMSERRENQNGRLDYYHLHWSRDEDFFKSSPKILSVRKCKYPTFVYTEEPTYVMMSMNVIKSDRINLKYLSGILNSNVISYFFKRKGKLQGENYQIDSEPLLETPIIFIEENLKNDLIKVVDSITESLKKKEDVSILYLELNRIVYEIYDMDKDDILTIENSIKN